MLQECMESQKNDIKKIIKDYFENMKKEDLKNYINNNN